MLRTIGSEVSPGLSVELPEIDAEPPSIFDPQDEPCALCFQTDCVCPLPSVVLPDCWQCQDTGDCAECEGSGETRGHYNSTTGIKRCATCCGSGRCACNPRRNY